MCPTLCDPIDSSPPGSPVPGILQATTLEWVAISFSNAWKWKVKVKSVMSNPQRPHGLQPTRLLHPWVFPGKSTGVGCHCFLRHTDYLHTKNDEYLLYTDTRFGLPWWLKSLKNSPAMQQTQFWSLGWEDPLQMGTATHSSILACRIPWTEEPGELQSTGSQRVRQEWSDLARHSFQFFKCISLFNLYENST